MPARTSPPQRRIHAILGSDDGEVSLRARELAARLAPAGAGDFGVETLDGQAEDSGRAAAKIHQTLDALCTLPFFGGEKLVWLKGANFLSDTPTGTAEATLEALEKLSALLETGLPDGVIFLLSATDPDKRRSFFKKLDKLANVQIFDRIDPGKAGWEDQAMEMAAIHAEKAGIRFGPKALELFVMLAGADGRQIRNEIEKLALHLGDETRDITPEDVRLLVPRSRSAIIWDLGDAIHSRNPARAMRLLNQLLHDGENPIGILAAAITPNVRNLLLVKDLMVKYKLRPPDKPFYFGKDLDRLPESATRHLPRKKDGGINAFGLGNAATSAHRFTVAELETAFQRCLQANIQLVSTGFDPGLILGRLLLELLKKPDNPPLPFPAKGRK